MKRGRNGTGSVYLPKGSSIYWIMYRSNGRRRYESSGSTLKGEAQKILTSRLGAIGKGEPITPDVSRLKFSAILADVVADYQTNAKKTTADVEHRIEKHIGPHFGADRKAATVTTTSIREFILARQAAGASNGEVNRELAIIRRAFRLAVQAGRLMHKPHVPMLKEAAARTGFLEKAQHDAIKSHLPADEADLVEFLFWAAWRKGEALGLQWSNVDRARGVIRIHGTKNGEDRVLPYASLPALHELIEHRFKVKEAAEKKHGKIIGAVFHRNGQPIKYLRRSWISACIAAGLGRIVKDEKGRVLEREAFRLLHDYRRSAARNMLRAGISQRVAMAIGGWKTDSVFRRYAIVDEVVLSEAMAKLGAAPHAPAQGATITNIEARR